ncbi:MAG: hypothetical protein Q8S57_05165 [Methanoregula sp.]|nr:hypothetical protein [Methanoregula sp.]
MSHQVIHYLTSGVAEPFSGTAHSLKKISGTRPSWCPFLSRVIAKRHAMTGSRLGCYAETGQPMANRNCLFYLNSMDRSAFLKTKEIIPGIWPNNNHRAISDYGITMEPDYP